MKPNSVLFSPFGNQSLFAPSIAGNHTADRIIRSVLTIGAVDYWGIFFCKRDRYWLKKAFELSQIANFTVSKDCVTQVANLNNGLDFLAPDFSLKADLVIICNVFNPTHENPGSVEPAERLGGLLYPFTNKFSQKAPVRISPHHFKIDAWSEAARKAGAKIIIVAGREKSPEEVNAQDFYSLKYLSGPFLTGEQRHNFRSFKVRLDSLINPNIPA